MHVLTKVLTQPSSRVAGIHLSGANASKTALVILSCVKSNQFALSGVYEKIGSVGTVFSDERLVDILNSEGPFDAVFIDCPLTSPPCARCVRPTCPGAWKCEDVEVAYMLAIQEKLREKNSDSAQTELSHRIRKKKRKPINPQAQRLWDALQNLEHGSGRHSSYNPSMAPLVTRAATLQRRLKALDTPIILKETAVPLALEIFCEQMQLPPEIALEYRKFGVGQERRETIFDAFVDSGMHAETFSFEDALLARSSVETFHAFIAAIVAYLHERNQTDQPPKHFSEDGGWVYAPQTSGLIKES